MRNKSEEKTKLYDELYKEASEEWSSFYIQAYRDMSFMSGNQWSDGDKQELRLQGRNAYVFNKIRTIINQISGYQKRNRMSSVAQPREYNDYPSSDFITDLLLYTMEKSDGYNVLSNAFEGALVTGINLISLWMDYGTDPINGEIKITRDPYNSFILDPSFTKIDLSDCGYVMRRRYVTKDTAKTLVPNMSSFIDNVVPAANDNKFGYMNYARRGEDRGLLRYDEFWERTTVKKYLIIDQRNGQSDKWNGTKKALEELKKEYPFIKSKAIHEPTVRLNVILEDELVYSEIDPYGTGDYPFVPVIGYYTPEYDNFNYKLQGVVRGLRDSQEELNMMRSKAADVIKAQVNSGWMVREGSVKNPADLYRTGQGVVIERSMDSQPADVQKIQASEVSQSLLSMISDLEGQVMSLAGVSEELMGSAEGGNTQVSGILAKQRAYNSVTTLQGLFDNLNTAQSILSKKIVKMLLANCTPEKAMRIVNKEIPQEMLDMSSNPPTFNQDVAKYDIVVAETALTDNQKNLAYMQMLEARNMGIAIPDRAIISAMPISDKGKLLEAFEEEQQQAQAQQQKVEEQELLQKRLVNAEIIHKLSIAEEDRKQAVSNSALAYQRMASAEEDISKAQLNNLKLYEELKGLKQDQLIQALDFVKNIGAQNTEDNAQYLQEQQDRSLQETLSTDIQPEQPPQQQELI